MEVVYRLDEIEKVAEKFLINTAGFKIFAFSGELGAGKTTFIKVLCEQLNIKDQATSPTYSIIQEYRTPEHEVIYHMDWYRLRDSEEAINAGVEECLESGDICFIEWPEKAKDLLSEQTIYTIFKLIDPDTRKIEVNIPE